MTFEERILAFCQAQGWVTTPERIALKLGEESGEVQRVITRLAEGRVPKETLMQEIGDVLIVLSQFAALEGRTLENIRMDRYVEITNKAAQNKQK